MKVCNIGPFRFSRSEQPAGKLKEYDASTACQAFPLGAHVVINDSNRRLLFYADPHGTFPVPPPFNFIQPGYGAHVSPTGGFRVG